jgi:predicted nucleic acid-binding protein
MSRRVFLDTSGWLAAISERESLHEQSLSLYREVLSTGRGFVTTNLVVAEMLVLLMRYRGTEAGLRLLDALQQDPAHEIRYVTRELERLALDRWLRPYADHMLSLTDAISFEVMRTERIKEALTLDNHFRIAGFRILPKHQ